jgi:predicted DNA-binding protein (MmcQ/YjbR family)
MVQEKRRVQGSKAMTYNEFNDFCGALPATSYICQWGGAHVWKVGGKVFAIGGWEKQGEPAFTFKASDLNFEILREQPGFRPAPYMASRGMKWIQQYTQLSDEQLEYYLSESHRLVASGLNRKKQTELGLLTRK